MCLLLHKVSLFCLMKDEALFGNGRRVRSAPEEKGLQLDVLTGRSNSATGRPSRRAKKGEVIEVITKDMIRKLK